MMPAPSPGPTRMRSPSVGIVFRCTRLDLYEQCSLHITENIASSVYEGSRPRRVCIDAYSSSVSPRSRWIEAACTEPSGTSGQPRLLALCAQVLDNRTQDDGSVFRTE